MQDKAKVDEILLAEIQQIKIQLSAAKKEAKTAGIPFDEVSRHISLV